MRCASPIDPSERIDAIDMLFIAFSSDVDAGSREENASKR
jgi:hypothetical protein